MRIYMSIAQKSEDGGNLNLNCVVILPVLKLFFVAAAVYSWWVLSNRKTLLSVLLYPETMRVKLSIFWKLPLKVRDLVSQDEEFLKRLNSALKNFHKPSMIDSKENMKPFDISRVEVSHYDSQD